MTADAWSRFVGGPTGYEVVDAGFKYNMTDVAAALALPQMATVEEHWQRREQIWQAYNRPARRTSSAIAAAFGGRLPARVSPLHSAAFAGRNCSASGKDHRRTRCGKHRRRHPLRSGAPAARTIASASGSPIPIFPTRRLSESAPSRCRCRRPCQQQDVDDVATALTRIFRYYKACA